jgi:AraC family transcriptional regulator
MPVHNRRMPHQPLERIVFATPRVIVGEWRCDPRHPSFVDSGPIQRHLAAFPRTAVRIRHAGRDAFVSDPGMATLYNKGQVYTREAISPLGDYCEFWSVDAVTAAEIAASVDARVGPGEEKPVRFERAPVDSTLYLRQRALVLRLRQGDFDELGAEEAALSVVHDAIAAGADAARAKRPRTSIGARDLAEEAARELALSWNEHLTLDELARRLDTSPFHLCRSFRNVTGRTLHRHLSVLRLRASLEAVSERGHDLTHVALDHGFSSHSHFTAAFRREYGITPSDWRARLHP